jgi:hypothetical protein
MKCPKCGRVWADGVAFCPVDDTALLAGEAAGSGEPDQVRPGAAAPPPAAFTDEVSAPPRVNGETTETSPPRMVEPISEDPEQTWVSPKSTYVTEPERTRSARMNVPLAPPPVSYIAPPQHPSAANSNPWKVAFLAMLGVLAIGAILFTLLRNNPNVQNSNLAPLTPDPNGSPVLTSSPPNGQNEISVPTVASPPPYTGPEVNPSVTPTPLASPTVSPTLPNPTVTPTASPTPRTTTPPNPEPEDTIPPLPRATPASTPRPTPAATLPL